MRLALPQTRVGRLSLAWSILSFLLLSSAVVLVAVSQLWLHEWMVRGDKLGGDTLKMLVVGTMDLTAATALGVTLLGVLLLGVLGFVQGHRPGSLQRREARGLVAFCWALVATMVATLVIASIIWFFTLRERDNFRKVWLQQDGATQVFLQDTLSCCGYFNASASGLLTQPSGFCASFAQPSTNATSVQGCVGPIVNFADYFLNNVFTTIYGFTSIQFSLFLVSCCLIIARRDDERLRRVWEKSGGGYFGC
ncbi:hypothetical protein JCM10213v2_007475 [Rhodosporidiobolus nylandii]